MNNIQWFLDRIGKRVYRINGKVQYVSVSIEDEDHALYLFDNQNKKNFRYQENRPVELDKQ